MTMDQGARLLVYRISPAFPSSSDQGNKKAQKYAAYWKVWTEPARSGELKHGRWSLGAFGTLCVLPSAEMKVLMEDAEALERNG